MVKLLKTLTILACLVTSVALLQLRLEKAIPETRPKSESEELLYLPKKEVVKVLAGGFDTTVADVLYIKSINYVMNELERSPNPLYMNRLFSSLTHLDPEQVRFYYQGHLFLASIAQRHQASLDILEHADGRRYQIKDDFVSFVGEYEQRHYKPSWISYKDRILSPTGKGWVSLNNPDRWRINYARVGYFTLMRRQLDLAADEAQLTGEAITHSEVLKRTFLGSVKTFRGRARKNDNEFARINSSLEQLKNRLANEKNEALRNKLLLQKKVLETRQIEIQFTALVKKIGKNRDISKLTFDDIALSMSKQGRKIPDPFGAGYVLIADGEVVSPRRVEVDAERKAVEYIRRFQEHANRQLPRTLEEAGLDVETAFPKYVKLKYDPKTGEVSAKFSKN